MGWEPLVTLILRALTTTGVLLLAALALRGKLIAPPPPDEGIPVGASISVKCGEDVYELTTGTGEGNCTTTTDVTTNHVQSASCRDDKGNQASMSCHGGKGACQSTAGSGDCKIKT